jgi:hypothetical protein
MAYDHAERVLAAIRLLEAQTEELLDSLPQLSPEQSLWLQEVQGGACRLHRDESAQDPRWHDRQAGTARARARHAA